MFISYWFWYVWENQGTHSHSLFMKQFVNRLRDMFVQNWSAAISSNAKLESYCLYKNTFMFEPYLDALNIRKFRCIYVNFRTSCHDLEIEKARYRNIPRSDRICRMCNSDTIENEYHFLLRCDFYSELRTMYIPRKYLNNVCMQKFVMLMSCRNEKVIKSVATYLYHAFRKRSSFLSST